MNTFKPEIQELLKAVEKKYSQNLRTTTDFDVFSLHLKLQLDVSISTSTLKRLWGYVKDKHKPRNQTLDSLAQYIGFFNFNEFCAYLKDNSLCNSSFFVTKQIQTRRNWNRMVAQSLPSPAIPRGFMVWSGRGPALQARARRSFRGCQLFDGTTVIPRLCFKRQPENAAIYRRA